MVFIDLPPFRAGGALRTDLADSSRGVDTVDASNFRHVDTVRAAVERLAGGIRRVDPGAVGRSAQRVHARSCRSDCSDEETNIVHRGHDVFAILNAFPYTTGHLMVLPYREVADLEDLDADESPSCGRRSPTRCAR